MVIPIEYILGSHNSTSGNVCDIHLCKGKILWITKCQLVCTKYAQEPLKYIIVHLFNNLLLCNLKIYSNMKYP